MSQHWKNILRKGSLGLLLAGVLVGAYLLGTGKRSRTRCSEIRITVADSAGTKLVTEKTVMSYLDSGYKGLLGMPVDSIDLNRIESLLCSKSTILSSEAYITSKGVLNISITQRKPVVRLQCQEYGFYSTSDGYLIPLQKDYTEDILTISGHIPIDTTDCRKGRLENAKDAQWLDQVLHIADIINASSKWKDKIGEINCIESGEFVIKPKEGREIFLFGHPEDIEDKFNKIQIYYERITADKGDDAYNLVDLRFKGQIVCKDTEKEKKKK